MNTYAERLKRAMFLAEIGQGELARKIGVTQQTIQYLCKNGKRSVHTVEISKVLGVSPDWLATGEGDMNLSDTKALAIELTDEEKRILWKIRHRMTLEQKKDLLEQIDKIAQKNEDVINELASTQFRTTG
jgi:transcriptional regulator with XRE-family HTH domain